LIKLKVVPVEVASAGVVTTQQMPKYEQFGTPVTDVELGMVESKELRIVPLAPS
jgi:hypothetical protein